MYKNEDKQFEYLVLNVACLMGVLRMVIALYNDFTINLMNELFVSDLIIDCTILLVFLTPIILTKFRIPFDYISIPFCAVLTALISINWFLTGGLESTAEYHFLAILFLFGMILSGRWMYFFIILLILDEIALIYLWYYSPEWLTNIKTIPADDPVHFISMAVGVTLGLLFFKSRVEAKSKKLKNDEILFSEKYSGVLKQNEALVTQEQELEQMNDSLEEKVQKRVNQLEVQKTAINEYMNLSLKEVKEPLKATLDLLGEIQIAQEQNELIELLVKSGIELNETIDMIGEKLKNDNLYLNES